MQEMISIVRNLVKSRITTARRQAGFLSAKAQAVKDLMIEIIMKI